MLTNSTDHIDMDVFRSHGEWDVVGTRSVGIAQQFDSDPGVMFPTVRFILYLRRKPRFYIINIVAPCVFLSILALFVFFVYVLSCFRPFSYSIFLPRQFLVLFVVPSVLSTRIIIIIIIVIFFFLHCSCSICRQTPVKRFRSALPFCSRSPYFCCAFPTTFPRRPTAFRS